MRRKQERTDMEGTSGKGKKYAALALFCAFCVFGWYRIRETLPPREADLRAMFAEAEAALPDVYEAEYREAFEIREKLPEHFGRLSVENEVDTTKCGNQYVRLVWRAFARNGAEVISEKTVKVRIRDTALPEIILKEEGGALLKGGEYDPLANVIAVSDPADGEIAYAKTLKKNCWTLSGEINTARAGVYPVTVRALDANGNLSEKVFPVTVNSFTMADAEHETDSLARIVLAGERIRIEVGEDFTADDAVLAVYDKNGQKMKKASELNEGTYTLSSGADSSKAGVYPVAVKAMNESGDVSSASFTVYVGSDDEIAAATGVDPASAAGQIYLFITGEMELNKAAACGIMANMRRESGYRPEADNSGMYHGLCQWGGGRLDRLYGYCAENGYYYDSIAGQLHFMQWELNGNYRSTLEQLKYIENSPDGAARAGSIFAVSYEGAAWVADSAAASAAAMFYEFGY